MPCYLVVVSDRLDGEGGNAAFPFKRLQVAVHTDILANLPVYPFLSLQVCRATKGSVVLRCLSLEEGE